MQKFSADGSFLASFGETGQGEGQFHRPSGVAVDGEGFIYVADWGNERVQVLEPDGGFQLLFRGRATISKWAADYFASNLEEKKERDHSNLTPNLPDPLSSPYHVSSQTEPYFRGPVSVSLDGEGRLYVTKANRHRFQVYQKQWASSKKYTGRGVPLEPRLRWWGPRVRRHRALGGQAEYLQVSFAAFNCLPLPAGGELASDFALLTDISPTAYHWAVLSSLAPSVSKFDSLLKSYDLANLQQLMVCPTL